MNNFTLFNDKCQKKLLDTYLCIEAELLGEFCSKFLKLKDDLQKNGRHDLKNE